MFCKRRAAGRSIHQSQCCQLIGAKAWGRPFGSHIWPVSMLVEVMSNGNGFHGLMYFDIVLHYQKRTTLKWRPLKKVTNNHLPPILPPHTYTGKLTTSSATLGSGQPWVPHGDSTYQHSSKQWFPVWNVGTPRWPHETTGIARADWRWGVRGCRCHWLCYLRGVIHHFPLASSFGR